MARRNVVLPLLPLPYKNAKTWSRMIPVSEYPASRCRKPPIDSRPTLIVRIHESHKGHSAAGSKIVGEILVFKSSRGADSFRRSEGSACNCPD